MNVERLHAIARALVQDMEQSGIRNRLREMVAALNNMANQPGVAQYQQQLALARESLNDAVENVSEVDKWPAAWQETLATIGVLDALGARLIESTEGILRTQEIAPTTAAAEIEA